MSSSMMFPKPWHVGQAPNGLLNEKSRGCGSSYVMPHGRHSKRSENTCVTSGSWLMAGDWHLDRPRGAAAFEIRRFDRICQALPQILAIQLHPIDDHLQRR